MESSGSTDHSQAKPNSTRHNSYSASSTTLPLEARLVIFTALALPVTLIPFFALRKQLAGLHRKLDGIAATTHALQKELETTLLELSARKAEHTKFQDMLQDTRRGAGRLHADVQKLKSAHTAKAVELEASVHELAAFNERIRSQLLPLRELGPSLANVAAFMQEIDMQQGFVDKGDTRGIERLRRLALRFERLENTVSDTHHAEASNILHPDTLGDVSLSSSKAKASVKE